MKKPPLETEIHEMLRRVHHKKASTFLDRQAKNGQKVIGRIKRTKCQFNTLGLCCAECDLGPCQIQSKELPLHLKLTFPKLNEGICGASSPLMQARNLSLKTIRGAASSLFLAKQAAMYMLNRSPIKNQEGLKDIASRLGLNIDQPIEVLAHQVASAALEDIEGFNPQPMRFLTHYLLGKDIEEFSWKGILPQSASTELLEANTITAVGANGYTPEFLNLNLKLGLTALGAALINGELINALFDSPEMHPHKMGFSSLEGGRVNIVIQVSSDLLSHKLLEMCQSEELVSQAKVVGASGINPLTLGNGLNGYPCLGVSLEQELVLATNLVEAMVVDLGSIWPALTEHHKQIHTKLITTLPGVRVSGDVHLPFNITETEDWARKIVEAAIENFKYRPQKSNTSQHQVVEVLGGFSVRGCFNMLSKINPSDPWKVFLDSIVSRDIRGLVLLLGDEDRGLKAQSVSSKIAKELIGNNVLVLGAGGVVYDCARVGLLSPQSSLELVDKRMGTFLCHLAQVSGIKEAFPPLWAFGAGNDIYRAFSFILALSHRLGVRIADLPIVASLPEVFRERWIAFGFALLALGIPTHFPLLGQSLKGELTRLTSETDPLKAASLLLEAIDIKRTGLNI